VTPRPEAPTLPDGADRGTLPSFQAAQPISPASAPVTPASDAPASGAPASDAPAHAAQADAGEQPAEDELSVTAPTLPPPTSQVSPDGGDAREPTLSVRARAVILGGGQTDIGRSRRHNEDHILVRNDLGLFVVSDGMGGHNAGEVASALAVVSVQNFFEATELDVFLEPGLDELMAGAKRLAGAINKSNADVFEISTTHPKHRGMGCTVVAAYVQAPGTMIHIAHLGDSRCYRLRNGKMEQLTRDHSLINDLLLLKPDLSPADVAHLPKNVVTRALGIEQHVTFDVRTEELEAGDVFMLCSDGLSGMLTDEQIAGVFDITTEPVEVSNLLVTMANDAGGHDNISVIVVRVGD
jgi:serine/threonine protein phosphatase PrpC